MYDCPHCNKPGISAWRKLFFMGPYALGERTAICWHCGQKVGFAMNKSLGWSVSYNGIIIGMISIMIYTDGGKNLAAISPKVLGIFLILLVVSLFFAHRVPLERR